MSKNILKYAALAMSLGMIGLVILTCMHSDMFHLPAVVVNEPWFKTTLVDFYCNIALLSAWVVYKEAHWLRSIIWIIGFITLGTIATAFYVFLQFASLKQGEGIEAVLLRRK